MSIIGFLRLPCREYIQRNTFRPLKLICSLLSLASGYYEGGNAVEELAGVGDWGKEMG